MNAPLSAPESARRVGLCCWMEQQVFALLGRWVTDIDEPGSKLIMLELSEHAAWRAQRWYELLPTAPPGADALVLGTGSLEALIVSAQEVAGPDHRTEELFVAGALLGLVDSVVADLVDRTAELAGATVLRIAAIARADISADLDRLRTVIGTAGVSSVVEPSSRLDRFRGQLEAVSALQFLDRT